MRIFRQIITAPKRLYTSPVKISFSIHAVFMPFSTVLVQIESQDGVISCRFRMKLVKKAQRYKSSRDLPLLALH